MTAAALTNRMTADDLLRMPESKGYELVDGQLVEKQVSVESSLIAAEILYLLRSTPGAASAVAVFGSDLGYRCFKDDPERVRKPDVSVLRRERLSGTVKAGFMPIPADLAVEVLSPNDLASAVSRKVRQYLDNGFVEVWVVDPVGRTCAVYTADAPGRILRETDTIELSSLLPSFKCRVGEFFDSK